MGFRLYSVSSQVVHICAKNEQTNHSTVWSTTCTFAEHSRVDQQAFIWRQVRVQNTAFEAGVVSCIQHLYEVVTKIHTFHRK